MSEIRPCILMELSPEEQEIILDRRAEEAHIAATVAFRLKAIKVANDFMIWANEEEYGPTFSTFVNQFNYQESDGRMMYTAVMKIIDVVSSFQIPKEKSQC
ncbi:hypothetical protein [Acinetobacter baumannii]|uniref:hypothetical protein n=1 Tax=Acinetobacter baumannii TaxID=470 RepID=UPI0037BFC698